MGQCAGQRPRPGREDMSVKFGHIQELIDSERDTNDVIDYIDTHNITPKTYKKGGKSPLKICHEVNPLEAAIKIDNLQLFNDLLTRGFSPYTVQVGAHSSQPIHIACEFGSIGIVKELAEKHDVSLSTINRHGETPLAVAIRSDEVEVVKYIVQTGVPVNTNMYGDFCKMSYLHHAVLSGSPSTCDILLSAGASLEAQDIHGNTPLHQAVEWQRVDCVRILLQAGADVNTSNRYGRRPVHAVATFEVYKNSELDKHLSILQLLVEHGANPNHQDDSGNTPLHSAIWKFELARYLIVELNVEMAIANDAQETPFLLALQNSSLWDVLEVMLLAGCMPSHGDRLHIIQEVLDGGQSAAMTKAGHFLTHTRSLQLECCYSLRRRFGHRLNQVLEALPMPDKMRNMIRLKHVFECRDI